MAFDIAGAKKAGYSDTEIADHLAQTSGFDAAAARKAGYSDAEITQHLSTLPPASAPPEQDKGSILGRAVSNIPASAGNLIGNTYNAIRHPLNTIGAIGDIAAGALQNALPSSLVNAVNTAAPEQAQAAQRAVDTANAAGKYVKDRYGNLHAIGETLANDPVGVVGDVSAVLGASGGLAAKAGELSKIAELSRAGQAVSRAGDLINPVTAITAPVKTVASGIGNIGKSLLAPYTQSGANNIAAGVVKDFAGDPSTVAAKAAAGAQSQVPGVSRDLAQATGDTGLGQLQRSLSDMLPQFREALANTRTSNDAARKAVISDIAGSPDEMANAINDRNAAATPIREAALATQTPAEVKPVLGTIQNILAGRAGKRDVVKTSLNSVANKLTQDYTPAMRYGDADSAVANIADNLGDKASATEVANFEGLKKALQRAKAKDIDPSTLAKELDNASSGYSALIQGSTPAIRNTLDTVTRILRAPDKIGETDVGQLYGAREHIGDLLSGKAGADTNGAQLASKQLLTVRSGIDAALNQATEGRFGKYLETYKNLSQPVSRLQVGQELLKRVTAGKQDTGNLQLPALEKALSNPDDVAAAATKFDNAKSSEILTPRDSQNLTGLLDDMMRQRAADSRGRSIGSNTVQNLASANALKGLTGSLAGDRLGGVLADTGIGKAISSTVGKIYGVTGANAKIQDALLHMIQNPGAPEVQRALMRMNAPQRKVFQAISAKTARPLNAAASIGGLTSSNQVPQ